MKKLMIILTTVGFLCSASYAQISFSFNSQNTQTKPAKNKGTGKESDNGKTTDKVTNSKLPDLSLDKDNCSIKITPGKNAFMVDVKVRMLNSPVTPISKGVKLGYYLTKGQTLEESDKLLAVYEIPEEICANCWYGTSYNFNLSYKDFGLTSAGKYYIALKVDQKDTIAETDENNNVLVIPTLIEYEVPEGVIEYNNYAIKEQSKANYKKEHAGQILFGLGTFDYFDPEKNNYVTTISFADLVNAKGSDEYGEELSFFVIYKRPLKDQFEIYRNQGLDKKVWPTSANWVNLSYTLIIDGKDSVSSQSESENLHFSDDFYSRWLTGKDATGGKLYFQKIMLAKLYSLSPGQHALKLKAYVQSSEGGKRQTAADPIAEGDLTINVTSEDKINHFKKYSTLKPVAKMTNTTLESQIKTLLVDYFSQSKETFAISDIKYFAITESQWIYEKNSLGEILSRYIYANVMVKYKSGNCGSIFFTAGEDYIGGSSYSPPSYIGSETTYCMPCEALK